MMRVLHLIDQPDTTGQTLTLKLSADIALGEGGDAQHAWLLIGGEATRDAAVAAGIDSACVRLMSAPDGLRKLVPGTMGRMKQLIAQADRVVCWTEGAARLASELGFDAESRFGQATLSSYTHGIIADSAATMQIDRQHERAAMRQRWGVPNEAVVVTLLADRPGKVEVSDMLLAMAFAFEILDAYGSPSSDLRLLCHPEAGRRMEAVELAELLTFPHMVIQDGAALEPWHTLLGCDLAIAPDPLHAGLSIAWADVLGLPIIAPPEPRLTTLADLKQVQLADSAAPKHLAKAMTDWAMTGQSTRMPAAS